MNYVTCPYCKQGMDICHDDGFGLEEDQEEEQECAHCRQTFSFTTSISIDHTAYCLEKDHKWINVGSPYQNAELQSCTECDRLRSVKS